jgi:predicted PurR-regulated permease PerM
MRMPERAERGVTEGREGSHTRGTGDEVNPVSDRDRVLSPTVSRLVRWGLASWSLIGVGLLAYLGYRYVLYPIRIVFPPLLIALMIVYLLNPLVTRLQRRGIPRAWGTLLTYVAFLGLAGMALRFLVPVLARQVSGFAASVPDLLSRAQDWASGVVVRLDLDLDTSQLFTALGPEGGAGEFISRIFGFTVGVLHVVLALVLGIVLGFYLLVDLPKIQRGAVAIIPARRRRDVSTITDRMGRALGGFFRGQLLVALFVGLASMLGLFIVGLPYWALVGAVAGLFNLIPLIGPFIGAAPALFIAFTTDSSGGLLSLQPGWRLAVGASVALLAVQQIDNHIVSPNVVARTVKLHPVTVMLGLLVGGTLLGLWGMLLAVPVTAASKILILHVWDTRLQWPPPGSATDRDAEEPSAARRRPPGGGIGPPELRVDESVSEEVEARPEDFAPGRTGRPTG